MYTNPVRYHRTNVAYIRESKEWMNGGRGESSSSHSVTRGFSALSSQTH